MTVSRNRRWLWLLAPALTAMLFAGAGRTGGTEGPGAGPEADGVEGRRELLPIPFATRDKLLRKMNRENLGALGRMLAALAEDDLAEVARIANDLSYSERTERASRRRGSEAFAVMATEFHGRKMPAIRRAAEAGDRRQVLRRMSEAVGACVSCHAATRLVEWPPGRSYATPDPIELPDGTPEPEHRIPEYTYPSREGSPGR